MQLVLVMGVVLLLLVVGVVLHLQVVGAASASGGGSGQCS